MKRTAAMMLVFVLALWLPGVLCAAEQDAKGAHDHPLLTRMPGFFISEYKDKEFDTYKFINKDAKKSPVEGHYYYFEYKLMKGQQEPGELMIRRNVQDAMKKIGASVIFDDNFNKVSTIVVKKDNKETWLEVRSYNNMYRLTIVEKAIMKQELTANADAMGSGISTEGHAAVYGIYFDTGKSEIKPESDAALAEVAKLMKAMPNMSVYVVGHTDNEGSFDANMKLSRERAAAVAKALSTKYGIAESRMTAHGVGSLAPVATNDSEEGRAKNRRVELVKQ